MKELTRVQTSKLVGGFNCDRIGRRLMKLNGKGRNISRNSRRYVDLGCVG